MNERFDDPAHANSPDAAGDPPSAGDRVAPGPPPPAANQGKDEPAPGARDVTGEAATVGSADPQSPRATRGQGRGDESSPAAGPPGMTALPPQSVEHGTAAPGNAQGVSVPATEPAPGTSQQSNVVEGVRPPPGAVPGQPEGEVDTRS